MIVVDHHVQGFTALYLAVLYGHDDVATALLAHGASPNVRVKCGETPLWRAAHSGSSSLLRALIDAGGDVSVCSDDGRSPLLAVVTSGSKDSDAVKRVVTLLTCGSGVDVDARWQGKTAEQWARDSRRDEIADLIADEVCLGVLTRITHCYRCLILCIVVIVAY